MALPYPSKVYVPFDILTAQELNEDVANVQALAAGTGLDNLAVTNAKLASSAVDTTNIVNASVTNAKLKAGAGEPGGTWDSWTPTLTNISGGTLNYAKYKVVGKTVFFRFRYTLSGAGIGASPRFSLPVTANADYASDPTSIISVGNALYVDGNGVWYVGMGWLESSTNSVSLMAFGAGLTYATINGVTSSIPFGWASGDSISVEGKYEAA